MWSGRNVPTFHMDRFQSLMCGVREQWGCAATEQTRTGGNAQGPPSVELRLSNPSTFYGTVLLMLEKCFSVCSEVIAFIGSTMSTLLHTKRSTFALPNATSQI